MEYLTDSEHSFDDNENDPLVKLDDGNGGGGAGRGNDSSSHFEIVSMFE